MPLLFPQGIHSRAAGVGIPFAAIFDRSDKNYLQRNMKTPDSASILTISAWVRITETLADTIIFEAGNGTTARFFLGLDGPGTKFRIFDSGGLAYETVGDYRDPTDFYHVVARVDTSRGAGLKVEMDINGVPVPLTPSTDTLTGDLNIGNGVFQAIGKRGGASDSGYGDGVRAYLEYIDGLWVEADEFGQISGNRWGPKKYGGAYGSEGWRVEFNDDIDFGLDEVGQNNVISNGASQYGGSVGAYSYGNGNVNATQSNRAIFTQDSFAGDFEFEWRYNPKANLAIGVYDIAEDATFDSASSNAGMNNMTNSWWIKASSVAANNDIWYGGTEVVPQTTINDADFWKITRVGDTFSIYRTAPNEALIHTWTQTSTAEVRIAIGQGDTAANMQQVVWADNAEVGNNFFAVNFQPDFQVTDTPTSVHAVGNIWSASTDTGQQLSIRRSGLRSSGSGTSNALSVYSTHASSTGKKYFDYVLGTAPTLSDQYPAIGILKLPNGVAPTSASQFTVGASGHRGYDPGGEALTGGSGTPYGANYGNGDHVRLYIDFDAGKMWVEVNGVIQGGGDPDAGTLPMFDDLDIGEEYFATVTHAAGSTVDMNYGQRNLGPAPLAGWEPWTKANETASAIPDSREGFVPLVYTGDGQGAGAGGQVITTGIPFEFNWTKSLFAADPHAVADGERGVTFALASDSSRADDTNPENIFAASATGYTIGLRAWYNDNTKDYASWNWRDLPLYGFEVNANRAGTGGNATVAHGLGVAPDMMFVKSLTNAEDWRVYLRPVGGTAGLTLNNGDLPNTSITYWNNTDPDASNYYLGTGGNVNGSGQTYVDYLFASIPGFSRVGEYFANASTNGVWFHCGFKPAFFIAFTIGGTGAGRWMIDSTRSPDNPRGKETRAVVQANSTAAGFGGSSYHIDFTSTGFKIRTSSDFNSSGRTIAWYCAAEAPQELARAS